MKQIQEFMVAIGTFVSLGMMIILTLACANGMIEKRLFVLGMVLLVSVAYICIKQIEKHFDGEKWK